MNKPPGLLCFSPPVMLATFAIEICLVVFTLWRYKISMLVRLSVVLLCCLAVFQLAEYMVCGGVGLSGVAWSRVGYVAITLLPPLGLHIMYELTGVKRRVLLLPAYAAAAALVGVFMLLPAAFDGHACMGNYVIFQMSAQFAQLYAMYYYSLIAASAAACWYFVRHAKSKKQKSALIWLGIGYALFVVPATVVAWLRPETLGGIPSIMCGFAVLLALALVSAVLPRSALLRTPRLRR